MLYNLPKHERVFQFKYNSFLAIEFLAKEKVKTQDLSTSNDLYKVYFFSEKTNISL